jgi:hypothetical protein
MFKAAAGQEDFLDIKKTIPLPTSLFSFASPGA